VTVRIFYLPIMSNPCWGPRHVRVKQTYARQADIYASSRHMRVKQTYARQADICASSRHMHVKHLV